MFFAAAILFSTVLCAQGSESYLLENLPRDSNVVLSWRLNQEREFLLKNLKNVWDSAKKAKLGRGLLGLSGEFGGKELKNRIETAAGSAESVLEEVDLPNLLKEGAIALNLQPSSPFCVCILKPPDLDRAHKDLEAFVTSVANTWEMKAELKMKEDGFVLPLPGTSLHAGKRGECFVIAFGGQTFERVEKLVNGESGEASFWRNEKWREAVSFLPPAEDLVFFLDFESILAVMETGLKSARFAVKDPEGTKVLAVLSDMWDELGVARSLSYAAGVSWTDGLILRSASILKMAEKWDGTPLGQVISGAELQTVPFDRVPGRATSVSFQAGVDIDPLINSLKPVLYKHFGRENVDRGLETAEEDLGFPPLDLARFFSGSQLSYSVKSVKPSLFAGLDQSVVLIDLEDPRKASGLLESLEKKASGFFSKELGNMISLGKVKDLPGFSRLSTLGIPGAGSLTWGIRDGTFYFSSSTGVLKQTLSGENRGERPFLWRKDYARLGVLPAGPVYSFSYMDMGRVINGLSQVLGMFGMWAAFMPGDDPSAVKVKKLFAFVPRLAAPVRSLSFLGGMASVTRFDPQTGIFLTVEALEGSKAETDKPEKAAPPEKQPEPEPEPKTEKF